MEELIELRRRATAEIHWVLVCGEGGTKSGTVHTEDGVEVCKGEDGKGGGDSRCRVLLSRA